MDRSVIAFKPQVPSFEVAGARLRCYLPVRYLRQAGWDCEIFQQACWRDYRLVIFQKTYTPEDQELARRLRARARVLFDLCDNHLYVPPDRPDLQPRADHLQRMIDLCDDVTVSTAALGKCIARPTRVIDDALDIVRPDWDQLRRRSFRWLRAWWQPRLELVWFGTAGMDSPPFGMIDLSRLVPMLNDLNGAVPLRLTVISNLPEAFRRFLAGARFPSRYCAFRTRTMQRRVRRADVCLVPVNANPFTVCKTANRPALALLLGVPVVADLIPSYEELRPFVSFGDWRENLARYAADPMLRQQHVRDGQRYLRSRFTPTHVVRQWSAVLETRDARQCA